VQGCHHHRRAHMHACSSHSYGSMHNYKRNKGASMYPYLTHMHCCTMNRHTCNAHLFHSLMCLHARLSSLYPCTPLQVSFDHPCTGGPTLTKSHCTAISMALPRNETLSTMQEDDTSNLALTNPGLTGSNSLNLQIFSENLLSTHYGIKYK
jgi:hypothetical protein